MRSLRLGLFLPTLEGWLGDAWLPRWRELRDLARIAEAVGFDALFVPDHLVIRASPYWGIPEGETRGTWECWTVLGALAEATSRVALGPFVNANGFRNPALLAKMTATLDEVSGGRVILGLGCGSHAPEYAAFGYHYDHLAGRFEEALQVLGPLLREGHVDFQGRYYTARDCELVPRGPRPGGPPLWIAAFRPRMLRLAARWGDGFNTSWHLSPEAVAEPFAALDAACAEVGRDPRTLVRSVGTFVSVAGDDGGGRRLPRGAITGTPEEIASRLDAFHSVGVEYVVCMLDPRDARGVERFAPVIEALRTLRTLSPAPGERAG